MKRFATIITILATFSACGKNERGAPVVSNSPGISIKYCVGRVKFSLPEEWRPRPSVQAVFELENVGDDGDDIELLAAEDVSSQLFKQRVLARTAEIKSQSDEDTDILELTHATGSDEVLLRIKRIGSSYTSELHKLVNNTYVRISTDSFNGSFLAAERRLYEFTRRIHAGDDKSRADSFCLGRIWVEGNYVTESVTTEFENANHGDALLSFDINTFRPDEVQSLFDRVSGPDSLLGKFGVDTTVIRKRELKMAGMNAQEWMSRMPATDGGPSKNLLFAIESRRAKPGRLQPSVHVEFETGRRAKDGSKQQNSLKEADAVQLWDSFVASLSVG